MKLNHLSTIPLQTERLLLRRYTSEDIDDVFDNWASDRRIEQYVTWERHPDKAVTKAVLDVWIEQYASEFFYHWAIGYNGHVIGDIAVTTGSDQHLHAEFGYCLGVNWWGMGLMTEALHAVLRFMFESVGLHRAFLRHDVQNIASGRVMEKNGLMLEGTLREHHLRRDGTWADVRVYGILRDEWEALNPHTEINA